MSQAGINWSNLEVLSMRGVNWQDFTGDESGEHQQQSFMYVCLLGSLHLMLNQGFENITDQFMLGENILVAPVVKKEYSRTVILPEGKWLADDGKIFKGGKTYEIDVPVDRIPYFKKMNKSK